MVEQGLLSPNDSRWSALIHQGVLTLSYGSHTVQWTIWDATRLTALLLMKEYACTGSDAIEGQQYVDTFVWTDPRTYVNQAHYNACIDARIARQDEELVEGNVS